MEILMIEELGVNPFTEEATEIQKLVKINKVNKDIFNKLRPTTCKFLLYLIQEDCFSILPKSIFIYFDTTSKKKYMKYSKTKHEATINSCISDLLKNNVLANTNIKYYFWFNTNIIK